MIISLLEEDYQEKQEEDEGEGEGEVEIEAEAQEEVDIQVEIYPFTQSHGEFIPNDIDEWFNEKGKEGEFEFELIPEDAKHWLKWSEKISPSKNLLAEEEIYESVGAKPSEDEPD